MGYSQAASEPCSPVPGPRLFSQRGGHFSALQSHILELQPMWRVCGAGQETAFSSGLRGTAGFGNRPTSWLDGPRRRRFNPPLQLPYGDQPHPPATYEAKLGLDVTLEAIQADPEGRRGLGAREGEAGNSRCLPRFRAPGCTRLGDRCNGHPGFPSISGPVGANVGPAMDRWTEEVDVRAVRPAMPSPKDVSVCPPVQPIGLRPSPTVRPRPRPRARTRRDAPL